MQTTLLHNKPEANNPRTRIYYTYFSNMDFSTLDQRPRLFVRLFDNARLSAGFFCTVSLLLNDDSIFSDAVLVNVERRSL